MQAACYNSSHLWRQAGDFLVKTWKSPLQVLYHHRHIIIATEGDTPCKHFEKHNTKCIDIGALVAAAAFDQSPYQMYANFQEPVARIAPHRISAIDRGEREEWLQVKLVMPEDRILGGIFRSVLKPGTDGSAPAAKQVTLAAADAWQRLVAPSMENEVRNALSEHASEQAIDP